METYELSLKTMRNKIFWVWYSLMIFVNLMGSGIALVLQGPGLLTYTCFVLEFLMVISIFFVYKSQKKAVIGSLMLFLVVVIEFPLLYLFYGEIIIAYFILGIVGVTVFTPRKLSLFLLPVTFLVDVFVILMADKIGFTNDFTDKRTQLLFNVFTFVSNGSATGIIAFSLIRYYERKKRELNEANEKLEYVATHDAVTGLNNRAFIMEKFSSMVENQDSFYAALLDIDNFKKVNDTYGHDVGDEILKKFAAAMIKNVGNAGFVGRHGGEEFLLIFNMENELKIREILLNIQEDFDNSVFTNHNFHISYSGGLGYSLDFVSSKEFIIEIDNRLYEAKKRGKKQVV